MTDFATLAQLARPTMMPSAPLGAGGVAGWMYGRDKSRQDSYLDQAANSANLAQVLEAQKAAEYTAGAPGRMSNINLGNLSSSDALDAYKQTGLGPSLAEGNLNLQAMDQAGKGQAATQQLLQSLATAETPEEEKAAYEEVVRNYPKFGQIPPDKAKLLANTLLKGATNTPAQAGKERIANIYGDWHRDVAGTNAQGKLDVVALRIKAAAELAQMKVAQPNLYSVLLDANGGDAGKVAQMWLHSKIVASLQQGQTNADTMNALLAGSGKQIPAPTPVVPAPTQTLAPAPKVETSKYKTGAIYVDAKGNKAKWNGTDWEPIR